MNSVRSILRHKSQVHGLMLQILSTRSLVVTRTGIFCQPDKIQRCSMKLESKVKLPFTWSICNYAKKATKEKGKGQSSKVKKVQLTQNDIGDIIDLETVRSSMQGVVDKLKDNYMHTLNLRTSVVSFEKITVATEDGKFPLNQLGQIVQKSPQMLMINLSSAPQYIPHVKKALDSSGLNINAQQEGTSFFIPLPKITREHREGLVKNAKKLFEQSKTQLSQLHKNYTKKVTSAKGKHSEDLLRNINSMLLDIMHEYTTEAEKILETKQKELLG